MNIEEYICNRIYEWPAPSSTLKKFTSEEINDWWTTQVTEIGQLQKVIYRINDYLQKLYKDDYYGDFYGLVYPEKENEKIKISLSNGYGRRCCFIYLSNCEEIITFQLT